MSVWRDFSVSTVVAGAVTILVGYTSSVVIVFEAGRALGASPAELASWMWALGIGMGLTCIGLSWRYRIPVLTAWSTPGAAMLIGAAQGVSLAQATGAFLLCAVLLTVSGFSGAFERISKRLPLTLAAGLLIGVLLRFGIQGFAAAGTQPGLVIAMFLCWLLLRRQLPRYAVPLTLLVGIALAAAMGLIATGQVVLEIATPVFTKPEFQLGSLIGIGLPLFLVTMASQNLPGVAAIRTAGYQAPISSILGWTGLATLLLAPFGAYALNLAAITAAICLGREAHEDPARRYTAAIAAGGFYLLAGIFGATIAGVLTALPRELVLCIAGLALIGTIGQGLALAMQDEAERDAALITLLVTASGVQIAGLGSAFWGLLAGVLARWVLLRPRQMAAAVTATAVPVPRPAAGSGPATPSNTDADKPAS